jgi:hypothetical protein
MRHSSEAHHSDSFSPTIAWNCDSPWVHESSEGSGAIRVVLFPSVSTKAGFSRSFEKEVVGFVESALMALAHSKAPRWQNELMGNILPN